MPKRRYRRGVLSSNLFAIFKGKNTLKKYARIIRERFHRKIYFVNINVHENDENKDKVLKNLLWHFYKHVTDRRRYRVVLLGTVGWSECLHTLQNFLKRKRRGRYYTMFKSAMSYPRSKSVMMNSIVNQIWMSNVGGGFRPILSAVVNTENETKRQPTFGVFMH